MNAVSGIVLSGLAVIGPYPSIARYKGGDPKSEKSFACED